MRQRLALLTLVAVALTACSDSGPVETGGSTYFVDAAAITATYESAAGGHFDVYLAALDEATAETGDAIYVDANQNLFAGLAADFSTALTAITGLTPPDAAAGQHAEWVAASAALNDIFQNTNAELTGLNDAPQVDAYLTQLPLRELQSSYRDACESVAELSRQSDGPIGEIVCEAPEDDGA